MLHSVMTVVYSSEDIGELQSLGRQNFWTCFFSVASFDGQEQYDF